MGCRTKAARKRQGALKTRNTDVPIWGRRRPKMLFSGLMTCGHCGGGYAKVTKANFGCSNARSKGKAVYSNMATLSQDELEKLVLATLQNNLMDKGALAELLMLSMETKQQTGQTSKTQGTEYIVN